MGTDLALPGAVSETALDLPAGLSFEDWQQAGETLGRIGRACQWWIGDWLNYGERAYGEKYSQAIEVTGYDYGTLQNFAYVAGRVEMSRRRDVLSFGHHQSIAALEQPQQDGWLEEAAAEGWSVSELRKQVQGAAIKEEADDLGPRKRQHQERLIGSVVSRMETIEATIGEIDLTVARQAIPKEKEDEWLSQLRDARTALSGLINSLA